MNNYIANITYNEKEYWIGEKPVQQINLLLAQDWNKFEVIDICINAVNDLSSTICGAIGGLNNIVDHITDRTDHFFLPDSYLLTINGLTGELTGISTIRINGENLYGLLNEWFLSAGVNLVSSFNRKSGQLECVSSIVVNSTGIDTPQLTADITTSLTAELGDYFKRSEVCVSSVNDHNVGDAYNNANLLSSVMINNKIYTAPQMKYDIVVDQSWKEDTYAKVATYNKAIIPALGEVIVNVPLTKVAAVGLIIA